MSLVCLHGEDIGTVTTATRRARSNPPNRVPLLSVIVGLVTVAALVVAAPADAKRAPTKTERAAIARLVKADIGMPAAAKGRCLTARVAVSTVNENWAYGAGVFKRTAACERWASNGFHLLSWTRSRGWRIEYRGSEPPACRGRVPAAVIRDLLGTRCTR